MVLAKSAPPPSNAQTLKLTVTDRSLIKASSHSIHPYIYSLSNLDLIHPICPTSATYFYPRPPAENIGDFKYISATIKTSLPQFLNHFFPFTGRFTIDTTTRQPQVLCNNEGAEFVEAQANLPLSSINFHQVKESIGMILLPYAKELPLCVQLVVFACGGFSVTWSSNHVLTDAYSLNMLVNSWAELVRTGKIKGTPVLDRSIFRSRSPPRFSSDVGRNQTACSSDDLINVLASDLPMRLYYVTASEVDRLRALACEDGTKVTRTQAFSAHVWKILATVVGDNFDEDRCGMGWLVDGRSRLGPKMIQGYVGNVLTFASAEASVQELRAHSLSCIAGMIASAVDEVRNEEHFLDLIDWIECHKVDGKLVMLNKVQIGVGIPSIVISSCHQLPTDVEFGFGEAVMSTFHLSLAARLGSGYVHIFPSRKRDGSWVLYVRLWPKVAEALESDQVCRFKPVTADYLGAGGVVADSKAASRL